MWDNILRKQNKKCKKYSIYESILHRFQRFFLKVFLHTSFRLRIEMVHCWFQNERSFVPDCHKKRLFWIPCRHLGFQNWYQILQFSILKQYVKSWIISYSRVKKSTTKTKFRYRDPKPRSNFGVETFFHIFFHKYFNFPHFFPLTSWEL